MNIYLILLLCCIFVESYSKAFEIPIRIAGSKNFLKAIQVKGDGSCLFHAISDCLKRGSGIPRDAKVRLSSQLRETAVNFLEDEDRDLVIGEGLPNMKSSALVKLAAEEYNLTPAEYLKQLRKPSTWGGGPEIISLSNFLKIPIDVYTLEHEVKKKFFESRQYFVAKLCARFGAPEFCDSVSFWSKNIPNIPIVSLLHCDSRYPFIMPGTENTMGDHYMALAPNDIPVSGDVDPVPLGQSKVMNFLSRVVKRRREFEV